MADSGGMSSKGQVIEEIARLDKSIAILCEDLKALEGRLTSILSGRAVNSTGVCEEKKAPLCSFASTINGMSGKICEIDNRIKSILNTLEI